MLEGECQLSRSYYSRELALSPLICQSCEFTIYAILCPLVSFLHLPSQVLSSPPIDIQSSLKYNVGAKKWACSAVGSAHQSH